MSGEVEQGVILRPGTTQLLGWLVALVLVSGVRVLISNRCRDDENPSETCAWIGMAGAVAAGVAWGAAPWIMYRPGDTTYDALLMVTMAGIAATTKSLIGLEEGIGLLDKTIDLWT